MPEHLKQIVVHVFRLPSGPGDDPYEHVAVVGPFDGLPAAIEALREAGWYCRKEMRALDPNEWGWTRPLSGLSVEIRPLTRTIPPE